MTSSLNWPSVGMLTSAWRRTSRLHLSSDLQQVFSLSLKPLLLLPCSFYDYNCVINLPWYIHFILSKYKLQTGNVVHIGPSGKLNFIQGSWLGLSSTKAKDTSLSLSLSYIDLVFNSQSRKKCLRVSIKMRVKQNFDEWCGLRTTSTAF